MTRPSPFIAPRTSRARRKALTKKTETPPERGLGDGIAGAIRDADPFLRAVRDQWNLLGEVGQAKLRRLLKNDEVQTKRTFQGIPVMVEWPAGSVREYEDSDFRREMKADYGYIRGTTGADGEELDVYVGPVEDASHAFVIAQLAGEWEIENLGMEPGQFDEWKVMLGYASRAEAIDSYLEHMAAEHLGPVLVVPMADFKKRVLPSLGGQKIRKSVDPRTERTSALLIEHARVHAEASDDLRADVNRHALIVAELGRRGLEHPSAPSELDALSAPVLKSADLDPYSAIGDVDPRVLEFDLAEDVELAEVAKAQRFAIDGDPWAVVAVEKATGIPKPLKSPGGKSAFARQLVDMLPEHDTYVEAYAGGAAVLFAKEPSDREVIIDIDPDVMAVLRFLKTGDDSDFAWMRKQFWRWSPSNFARLKAMKFKGDPRRQAYRAKYLNHFSVRGAGVGPDFSASVQARDASVFLRNLEKWRERLANVELVEGDALKKLAKYDGPRTVFFFDPPWLSGGRAPGKVIPGIGEAWTNFDVVKFEQAVKDLKGKAIVAFQGELDLGSRFVESTMSARTGGFSGSSEIKIFNNFGVKIAKSETHGVTPPKDVAAAARRGLELFESFARGGSPVAIARAYDLDAGRAVPVDAVGQMVAFFAQNARAPRAAGWGDPSAPSPQWVSYLLRGGEAGRAWATKVWRRHKAKVEAALRAGDRTLGLDVEAELAAKAEEHKAELGALRVAWHRGAAMLSPVQRAGVDARSWARARVDSFLAGAAVDVDLRGKGKAGPRLDEDTEKALDESLAVEFRAKPLERAHRCKFCDAPAQKAVLWAEGKAFIPVCDAHMENAEDRLASNGEDVDGVRPLPVKKAVGWERWALHQVFDGTRARLEFRVGDRDVVEAWSLESVDVGGRVRLAKAAELPVAWSDPGPAVRLGWEPGLWLDTHGETEDSPTYRLAAHGIAKRTELEDEDGIRFDLGDRALILKRADDGWSASFDEDRTGGRPARFALHDVGGHQVLHLDFGGARDPIAIEVGEAIEGGEHAVTITKAAGPDVIDIDGELPEGHWAGAESMSRLAVGALDVLADEDTLARFVLKGSSMAGTFDLIKRDDSWRFRRLTKAIIEEEDGPVGDLRLVALEKAEGEKRLVTGIVLEPGTPMETDAHNDFIRAPAIERAAHRFLAAYNRRTRMGVMHAVFGELGIELVESYIAPVDMKLGGQDVKKGSWVMTVRVLSDDLWRRVKNGSITGFSIGGIATVPAEDDDDREG
jgi:site-specific DNA-adenine methylase